MTHETPGDQAPLFCDRCSIELRPGQGNFYVIQIEAAVDPTPPTFTVQDLQRDVSREIQELYQQMQDVSPQELLDQVYRRVILYLCTRCYDSWIENPLG